MSDRYAFWTPSNSHTRNTVSFAATERLFVRQPRRVPLPPPPRGAAGAGAAPPPPAAARERGRGPAAGDAQPGGGEAREEVHAPQEAQGARAGTLGELAHKRPLPPRACAPAARHPVPTGT